MIKFILGANCELVDIGLKVNAELLVRSKCPFQEQLARISVEWP